MARINTAQLAAHAAQVGDAAFRANVVCTDPGVQKCAKQAVADVAQAGSSVGALAQETAAAWRRSGESSR